MLALVTVPDPPRLIATFLVLSRPRPGKNLLAYYVGCLTLNVFILLVPLTVVHFTPALGSLVRDLTPAATEANATVQPVPLAGAKVLGQLRHQRMLGVGGEEAQG